MASQFQNRLVGISILVACVVLFLPTIIDGKKTTYEDEFVATPLHPEIKPHTQALNLESDLPESNESSQEIAISNQIEPPKQVTPSEENWQVEEIASTVTIEKELKNTTTEIKAQPAKEVVVQTAKETVVQTKKPKVPENAWTIQLGAFQNAANINALLKTLHRAGYQAHTVPRDVIDGELTRVSVGPDVSKSKLEKQLAALKELTQLSGKLYPFDAVNP